MKARIAIASFAFLTIGFITSTTNTASAVVYCQYVSYPAGCVVRPGVGAQAAPGRPRRARNGDARHRNKSRRSSSTASVVASLALGVSVDPPDFDREL